MKKLLAIGFALLSIWTFVPRAKAETSMMGFTSYAPVRIAQPSYSPFSPGVPCPGQDLLTYLTINGQRRFQTTSLTDDWVLTRNWGSQNVMYASRTLDANGNQVGDYNRYWRNANTWQRCSLTTPSTPHRGYYQSNKFKWDSVYHHEYLSESGTQMLQDDQNSNVGGYALFNISTWANSEEYKNDAPTGSEINENNRKMYWILWNRYPQIVMPPGKEFLIIWPIKGWNYGVYSVTTGNQYLDYAQVLWYAAGGGDRCFISCGDSLQPNYELNGEPTMSGTATY